jgi:rhodanese-related sulfurtransferase
MRKTFWLLPAALVLVSLMGCAQPPAAPGWCTPKEAFVQWQAAPDKVHVLDVRTTGEYIFIGHAPMAKNIPVKLLADKWDADHRKPVMKANSSFIEDVKKAYKLDDTILVMCKGGQRTVDAIKQMKEAGFTHVVGIEGGFEGQRDTDCGDPRTGKFIKPGWKNSELLWVYDLDPDSMYLPEGIVTTRPAKGKT